MHITIFGSFGNVGQRITKEATHRGHAVVAVSRSHAPTNIFAPSVTVAKADASNLKEVLPLVSNTDLVIAATRPSNGKERQLLETTKILLAASAQTGTRIIFSGGAGSLIVPASKGELLLNNRDFVSEPFVDIARACADQHSLCMQERVAQWTYLSPPALLHPGKRTGIFRLGLDELLVNEKGESAISMEDLAVVLLDEAENPKHLRRRFTAAY